MTMPGQISIEIHSKEVEKWFKKLDKVMDVTPARAVLRKSSTETMVKGLKDNMTVNSTNLRKSFGNVTGKAKGTAVVFVGPRMDRDRQSKRSTPMGRIAVTIAAKYKGHLANIIEHNTFRKRYPRDVRRVLEKPRIPPIGPYPTNIREHSGVFKARPFIAKTYSLKTKPFLTELSKRVKDIIEKA